MSKTVRKRVPGRRLDGEKFTLHLTAVFVGEFTGSSTP
jgi:hypothetical protein